MILNVVNMPGLSCLLGRLASQMTVFALYYLLACEASDLLKVTYLCPCTTLGFTARIFDIASRPRYFTTKENQCSQSNNGYVTSQI